jgi:hypothetical protein
MKRTYTGWVLVILSWLIFLGGITWALFLWYTGLPKAGVAVILGSMVLAATLRGLANIGEFLFNLLKNSFQIKQSLNTLISSLESNLRSIQAINQTLEQINCDSKDINHNLHRLISFLEEIEKNLDLKK